LRIFVIVFPVIGFTKGIAFWSLRIAPMRLGGFPSFASLIIRASTSSGWYLHQVGDLLATGLIWCDFPFSCLGIPSHLNSVWAKENRYLKLLIHFCRPLLSSLGFARARAKCILKNFFGPEMPYRCVRQISATVINQLLKQDLRITENPDKVDQKQID